MLRFTSALLAVLVLSACTTTSPEATPDGSVSPTVSTPAASTPPASPSAGHATPTSPPPSTTTSTPTDSVESGAGSESTVLSLEGWGDVRPGAPIPDSYKVKPAWECYGPIILGDDGEELVQAFVQRADDDRSPVTTLSLVNPRVKTDAGIHMGSTLAQFKQAYPTAQQEGSEGSSADAPVWMVPGDAHSLVFEFEGDMVAYISLQPNEAERSFHFSTQVCGGP